VIKLPDVTGSIGRKPVPARTPTPGGQSNLDLPASISPALRTAALANDPAAEYELGTRYAEGRGTPQSLPDAVRWFERAADAGFAPAQFRLASLNEKGEGMKKDVQAARRLYLAAANKGHAKAMHNLAVLHAEGIDGKPDYKAASEWFRKAAGYGITDSQYNLAILYARGIGIPVNLAESYRWFAQAAANGDSDAAKKRDEVAARLDQQALATAKLAAQGFVAEREPDEATSLRTPPGGWDRAPTAPVKPRRQVPMSQAPASLAPPQEPASTAR
jgi:localization factor PodJL